MRQRVAFLRTLMAGRPVLLLDEPFASLDAITRAEMQNWLAGVLGPDRHTVVLVTHDVEEALYLSDRVLVLTARPARVADRIEIDGAARHRPRSRRHLAGVRRAQGARAAQPHGGGAMSRARTYLAPAAVILILLGAWELAARWDWISNALNIEDFLVPAPQRHRHLALARPLAPRRRLLGHPARGPARLPLRARGGPRLRGDPAPLRHACGARSTRCWSPRRPSRRVAIAPILIVWFGFGLGPKVLLIALVCFFPVTVNTLDGLRSVDPQLITMMRTLGASRRQILTRVELPSRSAVLLQRERRSQSRSR